MKLIRTWFKNNNIKKQGWFQNNKKEGTHYLFWQSGKNRSVNNFLNGKLHGIQRYYFFTGQLKKQVEYCNGTKSGIMQTYSIEGYLTLQCYFFNNKLQGECFEFDGMTTTIKNYSGGMLNGARRDVRAIGGTWMATDYINNKKSGDSLVFTENGILLQHLRYKNDKLHGECKEYHKGKIYCISNFKEGLKHGDYIIYFPLDFEDKIQAIGRYKNNKLISWQRYDIDGKMIEDKKPIFGV